MYHILNNFLTISFADLRGEIAALSAACLWAIASVVYGHLGVRIPPLHLNLIKGVIAITFLALTITIQQEFISYPGIIPLSLLLFSGIIGIGLGDIAFLGAINTLGASRTLLMGTLAPPLTAIGATMFLGESLNVNAWCGILLTILGVAWVITEKVSKKDHVTHLWRGVGIGLLAAIANATGALLSRAALFNTSISPLWAALLRLIAAVSILIVMVWYSRRQSNFSFKTLYSIRVSAACCFAAFCGTYLGIWLQQTAIKFTVVGIAFTLLQTSPLFIIPITICMGEKVSLRAIAGVVIAIVGIGLLFYLK